MKIRCKIMRSGGSRIPMPGPTPEGIEYHFCPNNMGDHVAEVEDLAHIQRFLSIPEGYEPYGEDAVAETEQIVAEVNDLSDFEKRIIVQGGDLDKMTVEELREEYHRVFGHAAPPLVRYDTLLRKLTAARLPEFNITPKLPTPTEGDGEVADGLPTPPAAGGEPPPPAEAEDAPTGDTQAEAEADPKVVKQRAKARKK